MATPQLPVLGERLDLRVVQALHPTAQFIVVATQRQLRIQLPELSELGRLRVGCCLAILSDPECLA